jgi:predicted acylesterase/phospholipase RssA
VTTSSHCTFDNLEGNHTLAPKTDLDAISPFRVLCLDGGGMRGLYSATYLRKLTNLCNRTNEDADYDIGMGFGLICGTSTGGMIACALASGVSLKAVITLYIEHGKQIFKRKLPTGLDVFGLRFVSLIGGVVTDILLREHSICSGERELRSALESQFGDLTIESLYNDRSIAIALPTVNLANHRSAVIKTPHLKTSAGIHNKLSIVDACLATTAAPIYRSVARLPSDSANPLVSAEHHVDGGLWANNPVLVAIVDALQLASEGQSIEIYCLGTAPRPAGEVPDDRARHRGLREWQFGGLVAELSIDAQQYAYDQIVRLLVPHLNKRVRVFRCPRDETPAAMMRYLNLDETSAKGLDSLIALANRDAISTYSQIQKKNCPMLTNLSSVLSNVQRISSV